MTCNEKIELLKMTKDLLTEKYYSEQPRESNEEEKSNRVYPKFPTPQDIVNVASIFVQFVE